MDMYEQRSYFMDDGSLTLVILVPCYIKYKYIKQKFKEQLLFNQRHNCVVMYTANKGMSGWPPFKNRVFPSITDEKCLESLYEPFVFFIKTSTKTLDIAYMMICIPKIYDALIEAQTRGVKIRLLMNFYHCKSNLTPIRNCIKNGISIQLYISLKPNMESIMHYKYMLKDYEKDGGYILIGSMNLSRSAFLENYEDIVFTSDVHLAKTIHDNFEKCWNEVEIENQTLLNKTTLLDVNLL